MPSFQLPFQNPRELAGDFETTKIWLHLQAECTLLPLLLKKNYWLPGLLRISFVFLCIRIKSDKA